MKDLGFSLGVLFLALVLNTFYVIHERDRTWKRECADRGMALYYEDKDYFMWIYQKKGE